jgi:hypothetical protein
MRFRKRNLQLFPNPFAPNEKVVYENFTLPDPGARIPTANVYSREQPEKSTHEFDYSTIVNKDKSINENVIQEEPVEFTSYFNTSGHGFDFNRVFKFKILRMNEGEFSKLTDLNHQDNKSNIVRNTPKTQEDTNVAKRLAKFIKYNKMCDPKNQIRYYSVPSILRLLYGIDFDPSKRDMKEMSPLLSREIKVHQYIYNLMKNDKNLMRDNGNSNLFQEPLYFKNPKIPATISIYNYIRNHDKFQYVNLLKFLKRQLSDLKTIKSEFVPLQNLLINVSNVCLEFKNMFDILKTLNIVNYGIVLSNIYVEFRNQEENLVWCKKSNNNFAEIKSYIRLKILDVSLIDIPKDVEAKILTEEEIKCFTNAFTGISKIVSVGIKKAENEFNTIIRNIVDVINKDYYNKIMLNVEISEKINGSFKRTLDLLSKNKYSELIPIFATGTKDIENKSVLGKRKNPDDEILAIELPRKNFKTNALLNGIDIKNYKDFSINQIGDLLENAYYETFLYGYNLPSTLKLKNKEIKLIEVVKTNLDILKHGMEMVGRKIPEDILIRPISKSNLQYQGMSASERRNKRINQKKIKEKIKEKLKEIKNFQDTLI